MSIEEEVYIKLQRIALERKISTHVVFTLYILEGFLLRLSQSGYKNQLILKGGVLLAAFDARRPTRDIDLAGVSLDNSTENVQAICTEIALQPLNDGITFDKDGITSEVIRDDDEYSGVRVSIQARLAKARIRFHIDVSVGDPITPNPQQVDYQRILGNVDSIQILGYPIEMVLAEKIVTAVQRGVASTRFRDFGDIYILMRLHPIVFISLRKAILTVLEHRGVIESPLHEVLSDYPKLAQEKYGNWRTKNERDELPETLEALLREIYPFTDAVLSGDEDDLGIWNPATGRWGS